LDRCGEKSVTGLASLGWDGGFRTFRRERVQDTSSNLTLTEGPRVSDRTVGYDPTSPNNRNLILFRTRDCSKVVPAGDACLGDATCGNKYDCFEWGANTIALTTTTYDPQTGRLFDADIEFNATDFAFTISDTAPNYDLQNAATHELGHSLGLDHSTWYDPVNKQESTMGPGSLPTDLSKRVLDLGSQHFVCDVYPKASASGCSTAPGAPVVGLGALVLLRMFGRRRRSAGTSSRAS
jgi:uncharacterized protein (TIGR03382 family)